MLNRDEDAKENAPEVLKKDMEIDSQAKAPSQKRSYSTSTRWRAEATQMMPTEPTTIMLEYPDGGNGHKFGLPSLPMARTDHFKHRYDPVVEQLTKSLMWDGKLATAQRVSSASTRKSTF